MITGGSCVLLLNSVPFGAPHAIHPDWLFFENFQLFVLLMAEGQRGTGQSAGFDLISLKDEHSFHALNLLYLSAQEK